MLGDILRKRFDELSECKPSNINGRDFWIVIRDIAREEILNHDGKIDSDIFVAVYYKIFKENEEKIPNHFKEIVPSLKQERYRIALRNVLTSNSYHRNGLANQPGIKTIRDTNFRRKGLKIIYFK